MSQSRTVIVNRMKKLKCEIEQYFIDIESYNQNRAADIPIDPDPDGYLGRMLKALTKGLQRENVRLAVNGSVRKAE